MKNDVDALKELDEYYSRSKTSEPPLTLPFENYEIKQNSDKEKNIQIKQNSDKEKNIRGYTGILKSYKFSFDDLRKIFYGVKTMETMTYNGKNIITDIIKKEKYNDVIGFAFGLGELTTNWKYFSELKRLTKEKVHKANSYAYFIFNKILKIGYENKKIQSNQEGKEKKNHYKNLFSDETLSNNFLEAFGNCKIPLNQSEDEDRYYLNELELKTISVDDPNIDGMDKSLYIKEINNTLKKIYGIDARRKSVIISAPK